MNRGAIGGFRPGVAAGRAYRAPSIGGARAFAGANGARGFGAGAGVRGGSIAANRGFAGARSNIYGLGTRPAINSAARFGGLSNAGGLGIANRGGLGLTATSLNRGLVANRSLATNRINTATALGYRGWTGLNSRAGLYGGYGLGYGRYGYGNGFGYGYGRYGYGGYGGYGYGGGWGWPWYGYGYGNYWPWYGYGGYGWGLGTGLGWGLGSWLYGSSLYDWGYLGYYNPYAMYAPPTVVYDYSQPINTAAQPPEVTLADQATAEFDAARDAFKAGEYARALDLIDQAMRQTPNETALHEFRALALFALQRYDEAAAALHAVLAVGPGWDWPTLIGLYPGVDVYTEQLRALEDYINRNPDSAPARLVVAYHYLTGGHTDAALQQFKRVAALQPKDTLTARLVLRLETTNPAAANNAGAQRQAQPPAPGAQAAPAAPIAPGKEGRLEGTWTAKPDNDSTITLTFPGPGRFNWTVGNQGKDRQIQGKMTYGNGILTLAQDQGAPMVGNITWLDETRFVFKVPGAGQDDPGLKFTKRP